jgi:PAS domain S-box-containing protein
VKDRSREGCVIRPVIEDQTTARGHKVKESQGRPLANHLHPSSALLDDRAITLAESLQHGMFLIDHEDRIVFVNNRLAAMLRYDADEMIGKLLFPFFDERCGEALQHNLQRRHFGVAEHYDYELVRKDGSHFTARTASTAITDAVGAYQGTLATVIDVSDLTRAGKALVVSEQRYRNLFEHSPVPLLEINVADAKAYIQGLMEGGVHDLRTYFEQHPEALVNCAARMKILEVSASALDLLAFESMEDLLQEWTKIILAESGGFLQDSVAAFADGKTVYERETVIRTLAGEVKHLIFSTSLPPADDPTVARLVVSVVDVTEQRRLEERLRHTEQVAAVGEAALMIGHDLRNPLQVITNEVYIATGTSSALPARLIDDARRNEMLQACETIRRQVVYMNRMVSNLQDSARVFHPRRVKVDVLKLLSDTLSTVLLPRGVIVNVSVSEGASTLNGDPGMLQRLLTNLAVNALQAMPTGGRLAITARTSDGAIELGVHDTGPGIKGDSDRIFQPFHTTKARGVGLGLAVCKRIAEAHGGRIDVASTAGRGARFIVRLPITDVDHMKEEEYIQWDSRLS